MDAYPTAERVAWELPLETEDVDELLVLWLDDYQVRFRRAPCDVEVRAARAVLEQRVGGALPPMPASPSTSGSWQIPCLELGVPSDE